MVCYDTLGPETISLICPGNVHYVHCLKQVAFSMLRLYVWTFFTTNGKPQVPPQKNI